MKLTPITNNEIYAEYKAHKFKFIELIGKQPAEKLSTNGETWEMVDHLPDIAMMIPSPFVVLDFDNRNEADIIERIIINENLPYRCMRTDRGLHVWTKSPTPWTNRTHQKIALNGFNADIRSYGKLCYVKIRKNGIDRKWTHLVPWDEIGECPKWLTIPTNQNIIPNCTGYKNGDGRANALFKYRGSLIAQDWSKDDIRTLYRLYNEYIFKDKLTAEEITHLLRDELFIKQELPLLKIKTRYGNEKKPAQPESEQVYDIDTDRYFWKNKFLHEVLAEDLMDKFKFANLNGITYVYTAKGVYEVASDDIEREMIKFVPGITRKQRAETLATITLACDKASNLIDYDIYTVNVPNGRLNLRTMELTPHSPKFYDIAQIPVEWREGAKSEVLERTIRLVFENDTQLIKLFYEMVGYTLLKSAYLDKFFILTGSGKNGKSTIMTMMAKLLGENNTQSLSLHNLQNQFAPALLIGKLANFGDDLGTRPLTDSDMLKSLTSGERIFADRKYLDPIMMKSYATLIFGCNNIPHIPDSSEGVSRRMIVLPFNHTFSEADGDAYDPLIERKLCTDEALQALLYQAVCALNELMKRGKFTNPQATTNAIIEYHLDNSTALAWIDDESLTEEQIIGRNGTTIYNEYSEWCINAGYRKMNRRNLYKALKDVFDITIQLVRTSDGVVERQFVKC